MKAPTPFTQSLNLSQAELGVVRACVRNIRATDEIDRRILEPLSDSSLQTIYDSDVVVTIIRADLPANLASFAAELIATELDKIIRRDWLAAEARRADAIFYAENQTFGLF